METTWWVKPEELDDEQKEVIALPADGSYLVVGPPGSGKTNLVLLRANYLELSRRPNMAIVVFTHLLESFLRAGAASYKFDPEKITTSARLLRGLAADNHLTVPRLDKFEEQRKAYVEALLPLVEKGSLKRSYDTLLLDEAQDYLSEEIRILRHVSKNLFATADSRQKIYEGADSRAILEESVKKVLTLRFHYRNGRRICIVADRLGEGIPDYEAMYPTSQYNEEKYPSKVEMVHVSTPEEELAELVKRISPQLDAYPEGFIGILCPKRESVGELENRLAETPLADQVASNVDAASALDTSRRIQLSTVHSAKGLEFRAVHIPAAENLTKFRKQKYLTYVGVTRAKTSLTVYHRRSVAGYFEDALLEGMGVPRKKPMLSKLFGGR
jgi:superfamily I DNA/RNA helicase